MPAPKPKSNSTTRNQILKIFSTKYSLTLPTSSLLYIESILSSHSLDDDPEELLSGIELWAKEYLKGEDPSPLVGLEGLKRAYESLQVKTSVDEYNGNGHRHENGAQDLLDGVIDPMEVNPEAHFKVVGAFEMPGIRFDPVRGTFVK